MFNRSRATLHIVCRIVTYIGLYTYPTRKLSYICMTSSCFSFTWQSITKWNLCHWKIYYLHWLEPKLIPLTKTVTGYSNESALILIVSPCAVESCPTPGDIISGISRHCSHSGVPSYDASCRYFIVRHSVEPSCSWSSSLSQSFHRASNHSHFHVPPSTGVQHILKLFVTHLISVLGSFWCFRARI